MSEEQKLAARYRAAFDRTKHGRAEWIEGTMELAAVVLEARNLYPANVEYGNWLARNGFEIMHPNDWAALVGFARHPDEARKLLERTAQWRWRYIWEKEAPKEWKQGSHSYIGITTSKMSADPKKKAAIRRSAQEERRAEVLRKHKENIESLGTLSARALTPEQIGEPELSPVELVEKYGQVRLHTKEQHEEIARRDRISDWTRQMGDLIRAAAVAKAAVPEDIYVWAERPLKREKLERWLAELEAIPGFVAQIRSRLSGAPVEVKRSA